MSDSGSIYASRRERVLEAMGPDSVALLLGAQLATRSADTHFPFRQDSDFWYLTGFDYPNAAAVLRTDGGPRFTLFVEPRDLTAETWNGYRPGIEGAVADFGADEAQAIDSLVETLPTLLGSAERIHHVLGRNAAIDAKLVESVESMRLRSRAGQAPPTEIADPRAIIHEMRLFKDEGELEIMRRAAAITALAHRAAAELAVDGNREYELEAALDYTFRRRGARGPAYTSIVGGGANATVLHYIANNAPLAQGELVLIDAGCELEGYASDVTRTYPIGGHFEGAGKEVYEHVLAAQKASLEVARAGSDLGQVHDASVRSIAASLIELGLAAGSVDAVIETGAYRTYYMHNTSHWLGLDVHDVGSYRREGELRPLETGMVFTVEPGIYIPANDEQADPRLRGIGVRIEDDVAITATGTEVITDAIPKEVRDVEGWVGV